MMKVYELILQLGKFPAGSDVLVSSELKHYEVESFDEIEETVFIQLGKALK
jgi:hypothetical protein